MATITKNQLSVLLEKNERDACTDADEEILTQWFEQVPVIDELTFDSEEDKIRIQSEIYSSVQERTGTATRVVRLSPASPWKTAAAAAVLCLCVLTVYFCLRSYPNRRVVVVSPPGIDNMPVTLPDSSLVLLSGGSSISYPETFTRKGRKVKLEGTAYFSVKPDKHAPFTIGTATPVSVKVLGTSFVVDVQKETENIKISVITGKVQIDDDEKKLDVLMPGERFSYSHGNKTFLKNKYLPEDMSRWQNDGIIYLNAVSLKELSVLLSTVYKATLEYDDRETAQYRFNMSLSRGLSLDQVLSVLETASGLEFERMGRKVKVSHKQ